MTAILVQFPDESVKLDEFEEGAVLAALEVMYEGGSLHGKTADFPRVTSSAWWLASTGVLRISLKPMSADLRRDSQPANDLSLCRPHC
jgi:hypothetical protein